MGPIALPLTIDLQSLAWDHERTELSIDKLSHDIEQLQLLIGRGHISQGPFAPHLQALTLARPPTLPCVSLSLTLSLTLFGSRFL